MLRSCSWLGCTLALLMGLVAPTHAADPPAAVSAEDVRQAIERGRKFLLRQQHPRDGKWPELPGFDGGVSGLCTLALINAGEDIKSAPMQRALTYLRSRFNKPDENSRVYVVAVHTMVFALAEPEVDGPIIARNVKWLQDVQIMNEGSGNKGGWGYGAGGKKLMGRDADGPGYADESCSQFALLALYEAERIGVKVEDRTWNLAIQYFLGKQHGAANIGIRGGNVTERSFGGWGYTAGPSTGSMTAAGIGSLIIASGRAGGGDAKVDGDTVLCCGGGNNDATQRAIEQAILWLGNRFSVSAMPGEDILGGVNSTRQLYYLYGLERVGRLSNRRFLGVPGKVQHDWYREGAEYLVRTQSRASGEWGANAIIDSCFALLFLSKGRWPVVMARLKHSDDKWTSHRESVNNLVRFVEHRWKTNLTWQVVDVKSARTEDLLEAPVLLISGGASLDFTPEQKKNLKRYVEEGGFIVGENCCGGQEYDKKFYALMAELFPDSQLRRLEPGHPIWFADGRVQPEHLAPLFGLDSCCRTSVLYCPESLSCYWELNRLGRKLDYSPVVQQKIQASLQLGSNILAYATNRQFKDKLDVPQLSASDPGNRPISPGQMHVAKLSHGGGADDAPAALANLLRLMGDKLPLRTNPARRLLKADDPELLNSPVLFMHGRRAFQFSPAERKALAEHLQRGGFLFADSICSSEAFSESFRAEIKAVLGQALEPIPANHELLGEEYRGFDMIRNKVTLREPTGGTGGEPLRTRLVPMAPKLEGVQINGRYVVVFSPLDLSCSLENAASPQCRSYLKIDAAKIGVNVLLYALQN